MSSSNKPMRNAFAYFRAAWGPRAAYHLARVHFGRDWRDRLISAGWLAGQRMPRNGAAPSMGFRGYAQQG